MKENEEIKNKIKEYLNNLTEIRRERLLQVINYIKEAYPEAEESMDYAPKTKFPMYKVNGVYVAIASMKNHISIHFGKYNATKIIGDKNPKIKVNVGCVNIKDTVGFPIEDIKKAIDFCFEQ